jgi:glycerate kinase
MRVLVAPDKFRGTLSAPQAAVAMADGWLRSDPGASIRRLPVADGGDGTLDVLVAALEGRTEGVRVRGPLGDPTDATFGLIDSQGGATAIVEMARASGLGLIAERRDAPRASTHGTGELILAAARHAPRRIVVCIGGSATTDLGAGMAAALGIRLLDDEGRPIPPGGAGLLELARVDVTDLTPELEGIEVVVACDVDNPLAGPRGAAAVYGPQKGADPSQVRMLDAALGHAAAVIHRDLGVDIRDLPGAGAAGGLGAGLVAFLGARIRPGFDAVAEALGLDAAVDEAEVVITGEGRYDEQSDRGKAPAGVLRMARQSGRRSVLIAGEVTHPPAADVVESLLDRASREECMLRTTELVEDAAADAARSILGG